MALGPSIRESGLDRIELTEGNFTQWVSKEMQNTPGFDAVRCFRTLHSSLYPGCAHNAGAGRCSFFLEAAEPGRMLVGGIVRWPTLAG
jgi:hypothetical protein